MSDKFIPFDVSQLSIGDRVRVNDEIQHMFGPPLLAGEIGTVGRHSHAHYPNLIIWFDDGTWIDPADFWPDGLTIMDSEVGE